MKDETLALPVYPELTRSQMGQVVETVEEFVRTEVQVSDPQAENLAFTSPFTH